MRRSSGRNWVSDAMDLKVRPTPHGPFDVKLTYFAVDTGAYLTEGSYTTEKDWFFEVVQEVRKMDAVRRLPGLRAGVFGFAVLIEVPGLQQKRMLIPIRPVQVVRLAPP